MKQGRYQFSSLGFILQQYRYSCLFGYYW